MPIVSVKMLEGRTKEQKAELAQELTSCVSRILGVEAERITCLIEEVPPTGWARGGVILGDSSPSDTSETKAGA